jgi:arginyl-tRNA--protein-N-Asp/Glu arginylyltransferase
MNELLFEKDVKTRNANTMELKNLEKLFQVGQENMTTIEITEALKEAYELYKEYKSEADNEHDRNNKI